MEYPDTIYTAVEKLHWLQIADDGVLEVILDNHMMQLWRACEARFQHEMIEGWSERGQFWFLAFGTITHKMIEIYYTERVKPGFSLLNWATIQAHIMWQQYNMDVYIDHPDYKKLGGIHGFSNLLLEYAQHFDAENEHFRVIGTELYFGKNKEVPLLSDHTLFSYAPFRLYLSGKIDLFIDDGRSICPMDHKTTKDFRGKNPMTGYEVQEGMTGYVYAGRELLKTLMPDSKRSCNKILMNFLQVKVEKISADRFKRIPLFKTDEQLDQYRDRMISTAVSIVDYISSNRPPVWNTFICNNYMHNMCSFQPVHRLSDKSSQLLALNSLFSKKDVWDCETVDAREEAERSKLNAK